MLDERPRSRGVAAVTALIAFRDMVTAADTLVEALVGDLSAVRAPRGSELHCKGWHQEAALRMLCNNLDPEVAEDPTRLVVYGGSGRAARSHAAL